MKLKEIVIKYTYDDTRNENVLYATLQSVPKVSRYKYYNINVIVPFLHLNFIILVLVFLSQQKQNQYLK